MRRLMCAGVLAVALSAVPAHALTITFQQGGSAPFNAPINNGVTITDFGTAPGDPAPYAGPGIFSLGGGGVYNNVLISGTAARPAFGSTGGYAAVFSGGSFTINFAAPVQVFSFVLGSLDPSNAVTLFFSSGPSQTFTGGQLNNNLGAGGNQSVSTQNGRVIFDAQGLASITGARFTSGQNSFEFDNLVGAVPEPGTWALMIFGFGAAGVVFRRRRRVDGKLALA